MNYIFDTNTAQLLLLYQSQDYYQAYRFKVFNGKDYKTRRHDYDLVQRVILDPA